MVQIILWRTSVSCRHRKSSNFMIFPPNKKALAPRMGNKDRRSILRYHLACRKSATSVTVPTHRLPLTQALRHRILGDFTPFPLPSAAHLLPRFSLRSQLPELSVDALTVLLPRLWFGAISGYSHLIMHLSVCQELFSARDGMGCETPGAVIRCK